MIQDYTKLIIDFLKIPKRKINRTFLEISGYPHYENVCSNILKFYFDPKNEHNLKDLFLKSLLQSVNYINDNNYSIESINVEREFKTLHGNRLDLLIETNEYIIGIENKIFYYLHNNLNDYSQTIENKAKINNKSPIKIILSLKKLIDSKIIDNGFINVTYSTFLNNIQKNIGKYLLKGENEYLIFLKNFISTMNNLNKNDMENKDLVLFFEKNHEIISELIDEFKKYEDKVHSKIYQLKDFINKEKYAPKAIKQWIYDKRCLVHDFKINNFDIAIDTYVGIEGWEIQLFGRNDNSKKFLFNEMCNDISFLSKPCDEFNRQNERIIYGVLAP